MNHSTKKKNKKNPSKKKCARSSWECEQKKRETEREKKCHHKQKHSFNFQRIQFNQRAPFVSLALCVCCVRSTMNEEQPKSGRAATSKLLPDPTLAAAVQTPDASAKKERLNWQRAGKNRWGQRWVYRWRRRRLVIDCLLSAEQTRTPTTKRRLQQDKHNTFEIKFEQQQQQRKKQEKREN